MRDEKGVNAESLSSEKWTLTRVIITIVTVR